MKKRSGTFKKQSDIRCCLQKTAADGRSSEGRSSDPDRSAHLRSIIILKWYVLTGVLPIRYAVVVYIKEADQIVTMLGEMGAGYSLMNLENVRILREMKGSINRRVNCETANMNRTAVMSARQIRDIMYIRDHGGLGQLKPRLREVAEARLMNPEASLGELGMLLASPIGKSGVNHRLQKLSAIAEELKQKEDSQGVS